MHLEHAVAAGLKGLHAAGQGAARVEFDFHPSAGRLVNFIHGFLEQVIDQLVGTVHGLEAPHVLVGIGGKSRAGGQGQGKTHNAQPQ